MNTITDASAVITDSLDEILAALKSELASLSTEMNDDRANEVRELFAEANDLVEAFDALSDLVKSFDNVVDMGTDLGFFSDVERITKKITREGAGRKAMSPEEKMAAAIKRAAK